MKRKPTIFILARTRNKRVWSAYLERKLKRLFNLPVYRATPNTRPKYKPERVKLVINYGCGTTPIWWDRLPDDCVILNHPDKVKLSSDKVACTKAMPKGVRLPSYFSKSCAQSSIDRGNTVVARTVINGHSGKGIVLCPPSPLPDCKLYTKLLRRRGLREYRIWFIGKKVVDIAMKRRWSKARLRAANIAPDDRLKQVIRAHKNGWVFSRRLDVDNPHIYRDITRIAREFLDWGCVDVLIDSNDPDYWRIVEINSAPGMSDKRTRFALRDNLARIAEGILTDGS